MTYQVIEADSREDALKKSRFHVGDLVRVKDVKVFPNSDHTFTVFTYVETLDESERISKVSCKN